MSTVHKIQGRFLYVEQRTMSADIILVTKDSKEILQAEINHNDSNAREQSAIKIWSRLLSRE